jgi:hypothetical protein
MRSDDDDETLGTFDVAVGGSAAPATRSNMLVTTDWLSQHLNDPKIVVLHVSGSRAAYDAAIPGARFVAMSELAVTRDGVPNELPSADLKKRWSSCLTIPGLSSIAMPRFCRQPARTTFDVGHGDQAVFDGGPK